MSLKKKKSVGAFSLQKSKFLLFIRLLFIAFILIIALSILISANESKLVITQEDENNIINISEELNKCIRSKYNPISSDIPFNEFRKCDAYRKLIQYDWKLIPYLIREIQIKNESRIIVGSKLAKRPIVSLEDLYNYQNEKKVKLSKGIKPWFEFPEWLISETTIGKEIFQKARRKSQLERFSWIEWWEKNKYRFEFKTDNSVKINTKNKYFNYPHISTEQHNSLLDIEAVHATYRQIIEHAAAELGIDIFIGEQISIDVIGTVRMKSLTFEEFAYLIGRTVYVRGFEYYKNGKKYHFGGKNRAKPRAILNGWGIMMDKTVFEEGETIPIIIITRGRRDLVNPLDPSFFNYGSFKIIKNDGTVIKDYLIQKEVKPTMKMLIRKKDLTQIELDLNNYCLLSPGEYNIKFKYLSNETPSIAVEIYKKNK